MAIHYAALLSIGIAVLAWRFRALTGDGALAAVAVGTTILAATGWPGFAVLGTFFGSSTLVSRLAATTAKDPTEPGPEIRDKWQVLANGGFAAIGALADLWIPGLGLWLVTATLAAAAGDTWATSLGALSPRPPKDILSGKVVP